MEWEDVLGLRFENLDDATRRIMLQEVEYDQAADHYYKSPRLNEDGHRRWLEVLKAAISEGDDDTLAANLQELRLLKTREERRNPRGGAPISASVPITAAQTLAEAQFNLYYMRALALRSEPDKALQVYRAKTADNPRFSSDELEGSLFEPALLLETLRRTLGVSEPGGFQLPLPNSGLTVRLT